MELSESKNALLAAKIAVMQAKKLVMHFEGLAMSEALLSFKEKEKSNPETRALRARETFLANPAAVAAEEVLFAAEIEKMTAFCAVENAEDEHKELQAQRSAAELEKRQDIAAAELKVAQTFESAYTQLNQAMQARLQSANTIHGGK